MPKPDPYWQPPTEKRHAAEEAAWSVVQSKDRRYRYLAYSRWDELYEARALGWIILHPGLCDPRKDPTLERIRRITQRMGYTACYVTSLYALRASRADQVESDEEGMGEDLATYHLELAEKCPRVVCAWGVMAKGTEAYGQYVASDLAQRGIKVLALGVDLRGNPKQPLYCPGDALPKLWTPA